MSGYRYRGAGYDINEPPAQEIVSHDPAKCGTYAGYCQHFYYGTQPCTPCREANNTYKRSPHLRKPAKAWSPAQCGTLSGYSLHYRHGVPVCAECRSAQSAYQAGYRERKRAA